MYIVNSIQLKMRWLKIHSIQQSGNRLRSQVNGDLLHHHDQIVEMVFYSSCKVWRRDVFIAVNDIAINGKSVSLIIFMILNS